MIGRVAGGALFQWLVEGLVMPCSNGWQRGWCCPVPMIGRGAGGALFQWVVEGLVVPCSNDWQRLAVPCPNG